MGEEIIQVNDVSMMFHLSTEKVDSLKEYVIRQINRTYRVEEFWALQGISFAVQRGQHVGILGLNGSGKSTLLKLVAGVLSPTTGSVVVQGTIAPMIELGAGFDINLSARENVFLNGAILGHSRKYMQERYERIIEFAELEKFQDMAIKNFSSGMVGRLGFAIATCEMPDVLIVDEILSVGDHNFKKKCKARMQEMTSSGTTVLFVSHSTQDVLDMCNKAIWLEKGRIKMTGDAPEVCQKYMNT